MSAIAYLLYCLACSLAKPEPKPAREPLPPTPNQKRAARSAVLWGHKREEVSRGS